MPEFHIELASEFDAEPFEVFKSYFYVYQNGLYSDKVTSRTVEGMAWLSNSKFKWTVDWQFNTDMTMIPQRVQTGIRLLLGGRYGIEDVLKAREYGQCSMKDCRYQSRTKPRVFSRLIKSTAAMNVIPKEDGCVRTFKTDVDIGLPVPGFIMDYIEGRVREDIQAESIEVDEKIKELLPYLRGEGYFSTYEV